MLKYLLILVGSLTLLGCKSFMNGSEFQDALIKSHSESSISELEAIFSKAVGKPVSLTDNAFKTNSRLALETARKVDINVGVIAGHDNSPAQVFHLTSNGKQCRVTFQATGESWLLEKAKCEISR